MTAERVDHDATYITYLHRPAEFLCCSSTPRRFHLQGTAGGTGAGSGARPDLPESDFTQIVSHLTASGSTVSPEILEGAGLMVSLSGVGGGLRVLDEQVDEFSVVFLRN